MFQATNLYLRNVRKGFVFESFTTLAFISTNYLTPKCHSNIVEETTRNFVVHAESRVAVYQEEIWHVVHEEQNAPSGRT